MLPSMPYAPSGDIELFYDTTGDPADPPVVLVAGLGQQMIGWELSAVEDIAQRGHYVIRFDNRDVGLSSRLQGEPDLMAALSAAVMGGTPDVPYRLADMAGDIAAVLDHLAFERAHIVGVSMGGMITQRLAIDAPERMASMTTIMSTTGSLVVGQATPEAAAFAFGEPVTSREAVIGQTVEMLRVYWGPHHWDEERARSRAGAAYDRAFFPEGRNRQFAALLADGDRTEQLSKVDVPTLVIHGGSDPLVDVSGGRAIADAVPNAKLVVFPTMGHDIPVSLWDEVRDIMIAHFADNPL
jgi:pimeloyl-ACP methyl ester carboxylesterase